MTDIFVPLLNIDDPITHIMDTLDARWLKEDALAACVDGDWVIHLQVVSKLKARSTFILEEVTDA